MDISLHQVPLPTVPPDLNLAGLGLFPVWALDNQYLISKIFIMASAKLEAFDLETVELAAFAKALSHPARIEIMKILASAGELPCMAIVRHLPLSQPACSRHINELLKAGLLSSRSKGSNVFFKLNKSALDRFCSSMNHSLHT